MKLGGLFQLGSFTQWELTAAQRALLLGPEKKSDGKKTTTKKPAKRLSMDEMREKNRRDQERKKAKENGITAT